MRASTLTAAVFTVLASSTAWAQCSTPFTLQDISSEMGNVQNFLRNGDDAAAATAAQRLADGLPCLNQKLPNSQVAAYVYRAIGAGMLAGGQELRGQQWFYTAVEVNPTFDFGVEDMPADHPAREAYRLAKAELQGEPVPFSADATLAAGAEHFLDGQHITAPAARLGRPHVYQLVTSDSVSTWVIEHNEFPAEAMGSAAVASADDGEGHKKPKHDRGERRHRGGDDDNGEQASSGNSTPTVIGRARPPEQIPLIIGGSALLAGSGVLYAMSSSKHSEFMDATRLTQVDESRKATNQLFLASSVVLGVGAGTLTWGIVVDARPPFPALPR